MANAINYEERAELADRLSGETDRDEAPREIMRSYGELRTAFAERTAVPEADSKLELGIGYHNSEAAGCSGDEVDGVYWCIDDGAWILSPAGRRFKDKFERKYFTSWG